MTRDKVLENITKILNKVLDRNDVVLEETTKAKDVDGWDSLNHAIFIGEVQKHFKVNFMLREVINLKNVGNICDLVLQEIKKS
jgi:acyl carrier protein